MSTQAETTTAQPLTFRRFKDGDHKPLAWQQQIFNADHSHKMKTGNSEPVYEKYVLKLLGIVRLAEK